MTTSNIFVNIIGEFQKKGFNDAHRASTNLGNSFDKLGKKLAAAFSVAAVTRFAKQSIKAFEEDEAAARRLTTTLENMGLAFEGAAISKFISDMEMATGVLDDELRPAMTRLMTTTGSLRKSQELLSLAIDVSRGSGVSLETVVNDLNRAFVGQTRGLAKYSMGLTQAELKGMSFAELQERLNNQFGGQAAAFLETYAGKVSLLNVAYANMQETVGEALVDAFSRLAGKDGIGGATKALEDFATELSDVINGISILIDKFKQIPGISLLLQALLNLRNFGILGVVGALGKEDRLRPKPFTTPMTISGQTDLYTKQDKARTKSEKDAEKRAKALAALQKKSAAEALKREREQQALKRAGTVFDMENIQIVAAMQGQVTSEQRLRLTALLAINNQNAEVAEKLSMAVLAINAGAFTSLGVILQAGDRVDDVITRLINAQTKVALMGLGITTLPKANDPFKDWPSIMAKILADLAEIQRRLRFEIEYKFPNRPPAPSPSPTPEPTPTPVPKPKVVPDLLAGNPFAPINPVGTPAFGNIPAILTPSGILLSGTIPTFQVGDATIISGFGALSPTAKADDTELERRARQRISDIFATIGEFGAGGYQPPINVTVNVAGNVTTEADLTSGILDGLYQLQKQGQNIVYNAVAL